MVHVRNSRGDFEDYEYVRAESEHPLCHVSVDAVDERNHSNDRRHTDDHPQQREGRSKFVSPQRLQGNADRFRDVHS